MQDDEEQLNVKGYSTKVGSVAVGELKSFKKAILSIETFPEETNKLDDVCVYEIEQLCNVNSEFFETLAIFFSYKFKNVTALIEDVELI